MASPAALARSFEAAPAVRANPPYAAARRHTVLLLAAILALVLGSLQQAGAQTPDEAASRQAGDPAVGKDLFEGTTSFENGGPSCLACHSIGGIGNLGGGTLGPDLTGAYDKFGEAGLGSILASTPLPTMRPIYEDRPLTEQEQADLAAFHKQAAAGGRPAETVGQLALLAVAGAALLLVLTRILWRRRLTEVRRPMLARSHARIKGSRRATRERRSTKPKADGR